MIHTLKILPEYYLKIISGEKTFELRKNDRNFKVGDFICLKCLDSTSSSFRFSFLQITYLLENCPEFGLVDGYCVLGVKFLGEIL